MTKAASARPAQHPAHASPELVGSRLRPDRVGGRYLYLFRRDPSGVDHRYTVDLVDGHIVGRARNDALLAAPS